MKIKAHLKKMKDPNIIDLIILDVKMPGIQGTEVLRRIKQINPDVFIVMLTGYGTKDVIVEFLRGHADDYPEKPILVLSFYFLFNLILLLCFNLLIFLLFFIAV